MNYVEGEQRKIVESEKDYCFFCEIEINRDNPDEYEIDWDGEICCKSCFEKVSDTDELLG